MATFKVGQRVRKIRSSGLPKAHFIAPIGVCGVVIAVGVIGHNSGQRWDYEVRYDGYGKHRFYADADQLEPIQPERNQTIAWSECVWKPEHLRETA